MIVSVYKILKKTCISIIFREDVIAYMDDSSDDECEMNMTNRRMTVPCSAMNR